MGIIVPTYMLQLFSYWLYPLLCPSLMPNPKAKSKPQTSTNTTSASFIAELKGARCS
jgi:hypothetical protein